jgi:hypothetical protein
LCSAFFTLQRHDVGATIDLSAGAALPAKADELHELVRTRVGHAQHLKLKDESEVLLARFPGLPLSSSDVHKRSQRPPGEQAGIHTSTSYVRVLSPGTTAYGATTVVPPKPAAGVTLTVRLPPATMPFSPATSPAVMPGTGSPLTRTITGWKTPAPPFM